MQQTVIKKNILLASKDHNLDSSYLRYTEYYAEACLPSVPLRLLNYTPNHRQECITAHDKHIMLEQLFSLYTNWSNTYCIRISTAKTTTVTTTLLLF